MQKQLDSRWHIGHRLLLAIVVVSFAGGSVLIGHAKTAPSVESTSSTSNAVTSSQVSQCYEWITVNGDSATAIDTVSSTTNTVDTSESSADAARSTTAPAVDTTSTKTTTARLGGYTTAENKDGQDSHSEGHLHDGYGRCFGS